MEFTLQDKIRKVFMTKKGFVMYMIDKRVASVRHAYEVAKREMEDSQSSASSAIESIRDLKLEDEELKTRKLTIDVKVEGLEAEYQKNFTGRKRDNKPEKVREIEANLGELIEEQVRCEKKLAHNQDSLAGYNDRIRNLRRAHASMEAKVDELGSEYKDIERRRSMVAAMDKTQVVLDLIDSAGVKQNTNDVTTMLGATENYQDNRHQEQMSSGANAEDAGIVQDRLKSIIGTRKDNAING